MPRTAAIIQARMGSTRLPGKVLKQLGPRTVLGHVIERARACAEVDWIVVATTIRTDDDAVAAEAALHGAQVYRGQEQDVLDGYYKAAHAAEAGIVVRLTADCPLLDPVLMGKMIRRFVIAV